MTVDKYTYDPETAKPEPDIDDDDIDDDDSLSPLASSPLLSPQSITIEQTPQSDGSIAVKASTTTPYVNGYRDVKIDHYLIPSSDVTTCTFDSQSQQPPSDDYLCRVEYRVLPPELQSSGLVPTHHNDDHTIHPIDDDDDDKSTASTVYTSNVTSDSISVADSLTARSRKRSSRRRKYGSSRYRTMMMVTAVVVFFAMVLCVSFVRDHGDGEAAPASPGYADGPSPPPTMPPENNDGGGDDGTTGGHHHNHKSRRDVIDDGGDMEDVNAKNSTEVIDRNNTTTSYVVSKFK